jgi:hypothetical protein
MIYGFRLLWAMKLREEGWSPWDVARFLSYEDSSHAARKLKLFWRVGMRDLNRIPYPRLVEEYVAWLTPTGGFLARLHSLQDLRARLQRLAVTYSASGSSASPAG